MALFALWNNGPLKSAGALALRKLRHKMWLHVWCGYLYILIASILFSSHSPTIFGWLGVCVTCRASHILLGRARVCQYITVLDYHWRLCAPSQMLKHHLFQFFIILSTIKHRLWHFLRKLEALIVTTKWHLNSLKKKNSFWINFIERKINIDRAPCAHHTVFFLNFFHIGNFIAKQLELFFFFSSSSSYSFSIHFLFFISFLLTSSKLNLTRIHS